MCKRFDIEKYQIYTEMKRTVKKWPKLRTEKQLSGFLA